mmetsp:Transcript_128145/g.358747  ORF Transcript_128145/g.358747 Transcript_128145/m.358747 type:complete len:169 (-) Transcript_128145:85-591(-)|eukprot:CAMPEP_0176248488 /NCGR_PEP_ID=MMETSP0121_2-20121125/33491_1 /TAXON_ID=160619 /ORGANISM="Kryptoperidinium foliaceum, Strain CCMP 1326" /LENGTH=168 /DNA_ID=CAMNT_0017588165 /DNA_START=64 /DNA_END=570 /DNA_ORIENTATION=-
MAVAAVPFAKQMEGFLKRVRKWDSEFLCLGNKSEAFTVPRAEDLLPRITANLDYFCVNYVVCLAIFALIAVVVYPQLLVLVCVFSGLWYALATRPANMKVQVGAAFLSKKQLQMGLAGFNVAVVLIFARTMIFATIGASLLFVLLHAGFRSVPSNAKDKMSQDEAREP